MNSFQVIFHKQILIEGDHNKCQFCGYGGEGKVVWRIEFVGKGLYHYHWLACNICRFKLFVEFGGRMLEGLGVDTSTPPKQDISAKGAKSSRYWALSWDRREALDRGESLEHYEARMFAEMDRKRKKENKEAEKKSKKIKKQKKLKQKRLGLV